jgi:23S rRNA (cytosine1962-C5)-methyltransferase
MSVPVVSLRPKHDRRVREGHPWVFSNELAEPAAQLPRGGVVDVVDAKGAFIGRGYANPSSLIAVRLLARRDQDIDAAGFWVGKLRDAVAYRQVAFGDRRDLRVVFGEGDRLPGLVIDRFGGVVSVQLTALGTEVRKELIEEAVRVVLAPSGAVLRSEGPARQKEGLDDERRVWFGEVPELVEIEEYGVKFVAAPLDGQKTGHFYDQATNRAFAGPLCAGKRVLDVYANGAGWALQALVHGATQAVAIDKSESCCDRMVANAALNGVSDRLIPVCDEGKKSLQAMLANGERFDVVMLDPPAFAKNKASVSAALRGYRDINALGLALVKPGGLLFTSSCSYHVDEEHFVAEVVAGARQAGRSLRVLRRGEQAADHPVRVGIPETRYLKSYAFHVTMDA